MANQKPVVFAFARVGPTWPTRSSYRWSGSWHRTRIPIWLVTANRNSRQQWKTLVRLGYTLNKYHCMNNIWQICWWKSWCAWIGSYQDFRARKQYNPVKGATVFPPHGAVCILLNQSIICYILRFYGFVVLRRIDSRVKPTWRMPLARRSHRKSRLGCLTCKKRRIKVWYSSSTDGFCYLYKLSWLCSLEW